jgi:hypothetical protein
MYRRALHSSLTMRESVYRMCTEAVDSCHRSHYGDTQSGGDGCPSPVHLPPYRGGRHSWHRYRCVPSMSLPLVESPNYFGGRER